MDSTAIINGREYSCTLTPKGTVIIHDGRTGDKEFPCVVRPDGNVVPVFYGENNPFIERGLKVYTGGGGEKEKPTGVKHGRDSGERETGVSWD